MNLFNVKDMKKMMYILAACLMAWIAMPQQTSAQTLRGNSNQQIGSISSDGVIRNKSNSQVGKIESNGTIRDRNNAQIGKIESDGTVRNKNNSSIGRASGVKKEWAAVAFFFFDL